MRVFEGFGVSEGIGGFVRGLGSGHGAPPAQGCGWQRRQTRLLGKICRPGANAGQLLSLPPSPSRRRPHSSTEGRQSCTHTSQALLKEQLRTEGPFPKVISLQAQCPGWLRSSWAGVGGLCEERRPLPAQQQLCYWPWLSQSAELEAASQSQPAWGMAGGGRGRAA